MPRKPRNPKRDQSSSPSMGIDRVRLRGIVERVEAIEAERAELASDIKDILAEAKSSGFDPGAIRTIVKLRKQDATERAEKQAVIDAYMAALGMLVDTPLGKAAMARDGIAPPV